MNARYALVMILLLALIAAACQPQPEPVVIPTLIELPTETHTFTPSPTAEITPTAAEIAVQATPETPIPANTDAPTITPTDTPSVTPTYTHTLTPSVQATFTPSITPSMTITDTITPLPTNTLTPTPDFGPFSALVQLSSRVTVVPIGQRYPPPTLTALAIAGQQIAAQTLAALPPGAVPQINSGGVLAIDPNTGESVIIVTTAPTPITIVGTPAPGITPQLPPPTCQYPPPPGISAMLSADSGLYAQLGCPVGNPPVTTSISAASQSFERGVMIYLASTTGGVGSIFVLSNDGRFTRYDDTWIEGVDPNSSGEPVPPGLIEPIRGFGKVWRTYPEVRAALGYALTNEQGDTATLLQFSLGRAVYLPTRGSTYIFLDSSSAAGFISTGTWRSYMGGF